MSANAEDIKRFKKPNILDGKLQEHYEEEDVVPEEFSSDEEDAGKYTI